MHLALNVIASLSLLSAPSWCSRSRETNEVDKCALPKALAAEIDSYAPVVELIINSTVHGKHKGSTWRELGDFVDKFGARFTGTRVLEHAIDYMLNRSVAFQLENVHGENVTVPRWIRGAESATLLKPRKKNIEILGLGNSVGTPKEGITAKAIVVSSFAELKERAREVPGKIVVYNQEYVSYGQTVAYRTEGASKAAELGAVAALIRSITPFSVYTPHTGMMEYAENVTKIPAACITVEDATLLSRISKRGHKLKINLKMDAQNLPDAISRNGVAEITGRTKPDKVVVVSGHIDSWDVGQGAMDDGGGLFISWNALVVLKALKLRPQRTVRAIMWTAEEMGIVGATQYIREHKAEEPNLQIVMESDIGTFTPLGLEVTGTAQVKCIVQRVLNLLTAINATKINSPQAGPDIEEWVNSGVPGASLWNQNDKYFWYHHTNADTMDVEDPGALDKGTALFAAVSYVLADLSVDLPRHD